MRAVVAVAVAGLLCGACQTTRQSWICAGAGLGISALGGLVVASGQSDEESQVVFETGGFLLVTGGLMALFSTISALSLDDG
jgi:hypothetical protein